MFRFAQYEKVCAKLNEWEADRAKRQCGESDGDRERELEKKTVKPKFKSKSNKNKKLERETAQTAKNSILREIIITQAQLIERK